MSCMHVLHAIFFLVSIGEENCVRSMKKKMHKQVKWGQYLLYLYIKIILIILK